MISRERSDSVCLLLVWCCVLFHCGQAVRESCDADHHSPSQGWISGDYLQRASQIVRLASRGEYQDQMKRLNGQIYRMYQPVDDFIKKQNYGKINLTDDTSFDRNNDLNLQDGANFLVSRILASLTDGMDEMHTAMISTSCINDTGSLIVGLMTGASWAFPFFDATGKPSTSVSQYLPFYVGNYDQCRGAIGPARDTPGEAAYRGNYCHTSLTYSYSSNSSIQIKLGLCLPSTCTARDVTVLIRNIVNIFNFSSISEELVQTECLTAPTKVTTATVLAVLILCSVGTLMVIGTFYDVALLVKKMMNTENGNTSLANKTFEGEAENSTSAHELLVNEGGISSSGSSNNSSCDNETGDSRTTVSVSCSHEKHEVKATNRSMSMLVQVLLSFSVISNGRKLISSSQSPGSIDAIHGIKFFSMSWVILCHVFLFIKLFAVNLNTWMPESIGRWTTLIISNGYSSVDTFFTISGLLSSYVTLTEMQNKKTWKINWPMFYFHRFWRLTPPYMFVMVIIMGLTQYMGKGPFWFNQQPWDRNACEKYWWVNLLYINNLVKQGQCFGLAWYLANDVQFFVISPLMLIPLYIHRIAGIATCLVMLFIHMVITGTLSAVHDWPTNSFSLKPVPGRDYSGWTDNYYIVPWCRIGPYIVGVLAGYVLAGTKGRQFRMPWWAVTLGWVLSAVCALAVVYGIHGDVTGDNPSSRTEAAFYNAVSRSVWAACVAWVIVACATGYGGPINSLLSWPALTFLAKLTYMSYMFHPYILHVVLSNHGALLYVNDSNIVLNFLGFLLGTYLVAFLAVLTLESPMVGLEKAVLGRRQKDRKKDVLSEPIEMDPVSNED